MIRRRTVEALIVLALGMSAGAAFAGDASQIWRPPVRSHALLVASDQTPVDRLMKTLRDDLGFEVEVLAGPEATQATIRDRLSDLVNKVRPDSAVVVLLGLPPAPDASGGRAVIPHAGEINEPWSLLSVFQVVRALNATEAGSTLLILPGCDDGEDRVQQSNAPAGFSRDPGRPVTTLEVCIQEGPDWKAAINTLTDLLHDHNWDRQYSTSSLVEDLRGSSKIPLVRARTYPSYARSFAFAPGNRLEAAVDRLTNGKEVRQRAAAPSEIASIVLAQTEFDRRKSIRTVRPLFLGIARDPTEPPELRRQTIQAIARLFPEELAGLEEVMGEQAAPEVRKALVEAALASKADDAREIAFMALSDSDAGVRIAALTGLSRQYDANVEAAAVARLVADASPEVRLLAVRTLAVAQSSDVVVTALTAALNDKEPAVRREAVKTFIAVTKNPTHPSVLAKLSDGDVTVQQAAAYALGQAADEPAESAAREALLAAPGCSDSADVREACTWSLGRIGGPEAMTELLRLVGDATQAPGVRRAAAEGLGRGRAVEAIEPLAMVLLDKKLPDDLRGAAAAALGEIGDPRGIDPLFAALVDDATKGSGYLGAETRKALAALSIKAESERQLLKALESEFGVIRAQAAFLLGSHLDRDVASALIALFDDKDDHVQSAARTALTGTISPDVMGTLLHVLEKEPLSPARSGVLEVITKIGAKWPPELRSRAIGLLERERGAPPAENRAWAVLGLARFEAPPETVLAFRDDPDFSVRLAVAQSLPLYAGRSKEARLALEVLAKDPVPEVRQAAIQYLGGYKSKY